MHLPLTFLGLVLRMPYIMNNWIGGSSAAFDVTVTSPLTPVSLQESSVTAGTAALLAEQRKHQAKHPFCCGELWELGL